MPPIVGLISTIKMRDMGARTRMITPARRATASRNPEHEDRRARGRAGQASAPDPSAGVGREWA